MKQLEHQLSKLLVRICAKQPGCSSQVKEEMKEFKRQFRLFKYRNKLLKEEHCGRDDCKNRI